LLTAIGLTQCGSSTVHIYTETVTQKDTMKRNTRNTKKHGNVTIKYIIWKLNKSTQNIQPYTE